MNVGQDAILSTLDRYSDERIIVSEILIRRSGMQSSPTIGGPAVIQVRERGQFTIPAEIRRAMGIQDGDVFSLVWIGDTLIATRKRLVAPEVATAIEALMQEEGVTLEDLLENLEQQRERYVKEKYGIETQGLS